MDSEITEFSFGFALTQQLLTLSPTPVTAAPFFPSLLAEGGLGYDVQLDFGYPLFLQFKLSEYMRGNASGQRRYLTPPYFRFWLMPIWRSPQHNLLVDLENSGEDVYYVAPWFWTRVEFNAAYSSSLVPSQSAWVRPAEIGWITDPENHCVIFNDVGAFFRSEPRKLHVGRGTSTLEVLLDARRKRQARGVDTIASTVDNVLRKRDIKLPHIREIRRLRRSLEGSERIFDERTVHAIQTLEYISYLSHAYLQAEFVFYPSSNADDQAA